MVLRRLVREASIAWARRLVKSPELSSTDIQTRFTFSGVTIVGTRVEGFRPTLKMIGCLEDLHEEQGLNQS